jgi:hypothetical protein
VSLTNKMNREQLINGVRINASNRYTCSLIDKYVLDGHLKDSKM